MPKIKSHAFNLVFLGITRDQHMPSWRYNFRHFLIQQHLNAITPHGLSLTLPMKSQDALPELQPLIRHGLISERRCHRKRGGQCSCSESGAGPEVKTILHLSAQTNTLTSTEDKYHRGLNCKKTPTEMPSKLQTDQVTFNRLPLC